MAKSEVLRFFKPLMNNFSAKLLIPASIAEHISKTKSKDKVTLVNHKCKMWHVDLHIENKDMYLGGESWQDFVEDNELEIGQLLFFKYKGNMVLTFRIFDLTSCERITLRKKKIARDVIDVEEEAAGGRSTRKRAQDIIEISTLNAMHAGGSNKKMRGKALMPVMDKSGKDACFEVTLTANILKRCRLYIPVAFRECSGLSPKHIGFSITDPKGRTWLIGNCHHSGDFFMSKGWSELSRENQLKVGDKLRFELVSAKRKDKMIHLNMFRL